MSDNAKSKKITLRGDVDRIEDGNFAVVLIEHDGEQTQMDIPARLLPPNAEAGASVRVTIEVDEDNSKERGARVASLRDKLLKGS